MFAFLRTRTENLAELVVQRQDGTPLQGIVRGPFCHQRRTLPTKHMLQDGVATIVDPCYWTPDNPMLYRIELEDLGSRDSSSTASSWITCGLRGCTVHRNQLRLSSRRYVLRAITPELPRDSNYDFEPLFDVLRVMYVGIVVRDPRIELVAAASRAGIPLIVRLDQPSLNRPSINATNFNTLPDSTFLLNDHEITLRIRQWSLFPAVQIVIVPHSFSSRSVAPTDILLAHETSEVPESFDPQVLFYCPEERIADVRAAADKAGWHNPILAVTRLTATIHTQRDECDALQRRLASQGPLAGYVVDSTT